MGRTGSCAGRLRSSPGGGGVIPWQPVCQELPGGTDRELCWSAEVLPGRRRRHLQSVCQELPGGTDRELC